MSDNFFDNVTVEDFLRATSAVSEVDLTDEDRVAMTKRTGFSKFVEAGLDSCQTAAGLNPSNFPAFAMLVSDDKRRYFKPDDDETANQWAARLQREAIAMNAKWMFIAMCAPARVYNPNQTPAAIDANNEEELRAALRAGDVNLGVCWFAERHDSKRQRRGGVITLVNGAPRETIEGDVDEAKNPFAHVLDR